MENTPPLRPKEKNRGNTHTHTQRKKRRIQTGATWTPSPQNTPPRPQRKGQSWVGPDFSVRSEVSFHPFPPRRGGACWASFGASPWSWTSTPSALLRLPEPTARTERSAENRPKEPGKTARKHKGKTLPAKIWGSRVAGQTTDCQKPDVRKPGSPSFKTIAELAPLVLPIGELGIMCPEWFTREKGGPILAGSKDGGSFLLRNRTRGPNLWFSLWRPFKTTQKIVFKEIYIYIATSANRGLDPIRLKVNLWSRGLS